MVKIDIRIFPLCTSPYASPVQLVLIRVTMSAMLAGHVFLTGSEPKLAIMLLAGTHILIQSGCRGSRKDIVTLRIDGTGTHEIWCEPRPNPSGRSAKEEWAGIWTVMGNESGKVAVFTHCRQLHMTTPAPMPVQ